MDIRSYQCAGIEPGKKCAAHSGDYKKNPCGTVHAKTRDNDFDTFARNIFES